LPVLVNESFFLEGEMMKNSTRTISWTTLLFTLLLVVTGFAALAHRNAVLPPVATKVNRKTTPALLPKTDKTMRARVNSAYANLPLTFERNQGQVDGEVKFLSRGSGYNLFLTPTESVLQLRTKAPASSPKSQTPPPPQHSTTVRMKLVNANPNAIISGLEELPGKSNYLLGNDPSQWRTNVPHYAKVKYAEVYPGIDLVYYGNQRELEYDLIVAPHADPNVIQLSFEGARQIRLNRQGDLELFTVAGKVVHHKPHLYQEINGIQLEIKGKYVLQGKNQVAFAIGAYNKSQPLVIDPQILFNGLVYRTFLGGSNLTRGEDIAMDAAGNTYITGYTYATDFPVTAGVLKPAAKPYETILGFVTKLNSTGTAIIYSTYLGDSVQSQCSTCGAWTWARAIAIDALGRAYVAGQTYSAYFPTSTNAYETAQGGNDLKIFLTQLAPNGAAIGYSTLFSGYLNNSSQRAETTAADLALDADGNIYLTGETNANSFFATPNALQTTNASGGKKAYLAKFNPILSGQASRVYATFLGGSAETVGRRLAIDPNGNTLIVGTTRATDFPVTPTAVQPLAGGNQDGFLVRLNTRQAGAAGLLYATYLGGSGGDESTGIAVNPVGKVYVAGTTFSNNFPGLDASTQLHNSHAFMMRLDLSVPGAAALLSTRLMGTNFSSGVHYSGNDVGVDTLANAYLTGRVFDATAQAYRDSFVRVLPDDATKSQDDYFIAGALPASIAVNAKGSFALTGEASGVVFSPSNGVVQPDPKVPANLTTSFVVRYDERKPQSDPPSCDPGGDGGGDAIVSANRANPAFALDALPPCPPPSTTPVIFIPGIAASILEDVDGTKGFARTQLSPPDINFLGILQTLFGKIQGEKTYADRIRDNLTLNPAKQQSIADREIEIIATDAIRGIFGELLNYLKLPENGGYVEYDLKIDPVHPKTPTDTCDLSQQNRNPKPTLFVFPYDWRYSNTVAAAKLASYVNCVKAITGSEKVDLVAHSMGGLVARKYALDNASNVRKMITIATPWLGAPKSINVLETGKFNQNEGWFGVVSDVKNLASANTTRQLYEFFNGGHELLPNPGYFNLGGQPFWERPEDKKATPTPFNYDQYTFRLDAWYPTNGFKPGTVNKLFFTDSRLFDWRNDTTGVKYYQILGIRKNQDTDTKVTSILINKCEPRDDNQHCKKEHTVKVDRGFGDGTVPVLSSLRTGVDGTGATINLAGNNVETFIYDQRTNTYGDSYDYQHLGLLTNPFVQARVRDWLKEPLSSSPQNIAAATVPSAEFEVNNVTEATQEQSEEQWFLELKGAELTSGEDDKGNTHASPRGIPGATLANLGAILELGKTYTIKFAVHFDNPNDRELVRIEINKSTNNADENKSLVIWYIDLPMQKGQEAMLKFTPQGVEPLRLDTDGDGVFETVVQPTAVNSGPKPLDLEGPDLLHDFTWREDGVAVALTTSDPAGVKGYTWYALDPQKMDTRTNDAVPVVFSKYVNSFVANPTQFASLRAWADDNLANHANYLTDFTAPKLSQNSPSFQSTGGTGTVNVTFNEEADDLVKLRWVAVSKVPWLTITGGANGLAIAADDKKSSSGTVTFTVAPNNTSSPRTGTLNIGGQIFTVTQEAGGDTTPPTITAPANLTVTTSTSQCTTPVNPGTPTVSDNLPGAIFAGQRSDNKPLTDPYPLGVTTITWTATDTAGNTAAATQTVTVTNPAPLVTLTGPATGTVFAVGTAANFTGSFTDNPGAHTATWSFDGFTAAGTVDEATGTVSGSFTFTTAGVYKVTLTVMDGCGGTGTANTIDGLDLLVVVYDPNGGWVTGGGWINSPAGAYLLDPTLAGKANFGFVSKYHNGATIPTGNTEFQFKAGNLNFSSTVYEWLVIAGARAQYRGAGTINGAGDYRFMLTAIDGQEPGGGGQDKFRIRIWNNAGGGLVYDNQMNAPDNADPTTVLGGGQIVIHK
jgi:pimeloyl-ACP methyl ester carboxylesterase